MIPVWYRLVVNVVAGSSTLRLFVFEPVVSTAAIAAAAVGCLLVGVSFAV